MARSPIRVFVAEDHPLYRDGLAEAIRLRPEFSLVGQAGDGRTALEQIRALEPDVAVLDIKMPQLDGVQVLHAIERDGLTTRVLLVSAFSEGERVHDALTRGASGFVSKESSGAEICEAITIAARGGTALGPEMQSALAGELRLRKATAGPRLSEREAEILRLLADGMSSSEIAEQLIVTTVKTHLRNLYDKLEVSDRAAAVAQAMRGGLLE
jgi:two-component system nitrate/nitrite response regulator NarL